MSQMNHNASYLTVVDGNTVWERLRVIRNFLVDRHQALALAELGLRKSDRKIKLLTEKVDSTIEEQDELEEAEIYLPQSKSLIEDAKREIKFLEEFEAKLAVEAEKTRIPGKTDEEMYEINYFEELIQIQLLDMQSEMMSMGHLTSNTMKTLIRNPETMERAIKLGLLNEQVKSVLEATKSPIVQLLKADSALQITQ